MGCVHLDIGGAQARQFLNLLAKDFDDVGEKTLEAGVGAFGALRGPKIHKEPGTGQCHLRGPCGTGSEIHELLRRQVSLAPELCDHAQIGWSFAAPIADRIVAVPLAPQKRIDVPLPETLHGLGHLALERQSPHLTVRDHFQARLLLEDDGLIDGAVLDGLEMGLVDTTGRQVLLRFEKLRWPEQAANDVGMCGNHGRSLA